MNGLAGGMSPEPVSGSTPSEFGPIHTTWLAAGAEDVVGSHLNAVRPVWPTVLGLAGMHAELLQDLVVVSQPIASVSDIALISVGSHGFNLFAEILGAGLRGRFDVVLHLFRGLTDAAGVAFGVGTDAEAAQLFVSGGEYKAVRGRKAQLDYLSTANPGLAAQRDVDLAQRASALNDVSHISLAHADRVVQLQDGKLQPSIGGRSSPPEMRALVWAAANAEGELLVSLWGARAEILPVSWGDRFSGPQSELRKWWEALPEHEKRIADEVPKTR